MSAAFRRPGAVVATVAQSRARTLGTGQEIIIIIIIIIIIDFIYRG